MGLQTIFLHVWLVIRSFLRRLPTRIWRVAWVVIWRRFQKRDPKPPVPRSGSGDTHTYTQISVQGSRVPSGRRVGVRSSSFSHSRGLGDGLQFEPTSYTSHSTLSIQSFPPAEEPSNLGSGDSGSDFAIPIRVRSPNQSEELVDHPESHPVEAGLLWSDYRPDNIPPNDTNSRSPSENASLRSSPRSFTSTIPALHDISRQSISIEARGSRVSIVILPAVQPHEDLPEHQSFQADSNLEVADHIYPLLPTKLKRYKRNRILPRCDTPEVTIRPGVRDYAQRVLPEGWVQYIHPEGRPIFYNEEKRILTESLILQEEIYDCLTSSYSRLQDFSRSRRYEFPPDYHLVLDVEEKLEGTDQYWCGYYYVRHSPRVMFWLDKFEISDEFALAEVEDARIGIYLEYQYWYHWGLFPNTNNLTPPILDLVANHISDVRTDVLTSPESTMPFSLEEINIWANMVRDAREQLVRGEHPTTWFVGRFMGFLCESRFFNFYGQFGARLSRKQSIRGPLQRHQTYLIKTLSLLLFSAPNAHLEAMEDCWVDNLTLKVPWSDFFAQLVKEWKGHTAYASILLNANVAFLAIPSNDPTYDTMVHIRTPTQIVSYLSVISSSASMLLALLLLRRYRTKSRNNVGETHAFLKKNYHPVRGFETLAILYSLPYAFLLWGLVTFFAAFFIMCFQNSNAVTRSVIGVASFLAGILIVWCIWTGWEESQYHSWSLLMGWARGQWDGKSMMRSLSKESARLKIPLWLVQFWRKPTSPSDA